MKFLCDELDHYSLDFFYIRDGDECSSWETEERLKEIFDKYLKFIEKAIEWRIYDYDCGTIILSDGSKWQWDRETVSFQELISAGLDDIPWSKSFVPIASLKEGTTTWYTLKEEIE